MSKKFSAEEAGRYLGSEQHPIATATLAWWRCKGRGPRYVKLGGRVFYFENDLDDFIRASTTAPEFRA